MPKFILNYETISNNFARSLCPSCSPRDPSSSPFGYCRIWKIFTVYSIIRILHDIWQTGIAIHFTFCFAFLGQSYITCRMGERGTMVDYVITSAFARRSRTDFTSRSGCRIIHENWIPSNANCVRLPKLRNILGVVKRNPLFLHEIEWKNNGFLFITSNIKG